MVSFVLNVGLRWVLVLGPFRLAPRPSGPLVVGPPWLGDQQHKGPTPNRTGGKGKRNHFPPKTNAEREPVKRETKSPRKPNNPVNTIDCFLRGHRVWGWSLVFCIAFGSPAFAVVSFALFAGSRSVLVLVSRTASVSHFKIYSLNAPLLIKFISIKMRLYIYIYLTQCRARSNINDNRRILKI